MVALYPSLTQRCHVTVMNAEYVDATWLFQVNHWMSHWGWPERKAVWTEVAHWYFMGLEPRDAAIRLLAQ